MDAQDIQDLVIRLYEVEEYRPVCVAVLYHTSKDGNRRYLVTQSAKALEAWAFPQGGIEKHETLEENLSRELAEELGIDFFRDIVDIRFAYHYEELDAEPTRKEKRGFTRGKAYLFTLAHYIGDSNFNLQQEEVVDAKWLTYNEALEHFEKGRLEKVALLRNGLEKAIELLDFFNVD